MLLLQWQCWKNCLACEMRVFCIFDDGGWFPFQRWLRKTYLLLKGRVSDFWKPMLIFEIPTTNTPLPQKGLAPILIDPPHICVAYTTQATISSVKHKVLFHRNNLEQYAPEIRRSRRCLFDVCICICKMYFLECLFICNTSICFLLDVK